MYNSVIELSKLLSSISHSAPYLTRFDLLFFFISWISPLDSVTPNEQNFTLFRLAMIQM